MTSISRTPSVLNPQKNTTDIWFVNWFYSIWTLLILIAFSIKGCADKPKKVCTDFNELEPDSIPIACLGFAMVALGFILIIGIGTVFSIVQAILLSKS